MMKDGSLRADIEAALTEVTTKDDVEPDAGEPAVVGQETAGAARGRDGGASEGGDTGNQTESEPAEAEEAQPEAENDEGAGSGGGEGSGLESADVAAVEPPEHWSADDKARFAALPDDATRQTVLDWRKQIERGADEKFQAAAEARKFHEEAGRLLQPYDHELAMVGENRIDGIRRLVRAHEMLRQDFSGGLAWIAQNYGRSVAGSGQAQEIVRRIASALGVEAAGDGKAEPMSPEAQRIAALEQRLAEQDRAHQQAELSQRHAAVQSAQQAIQTFADAKDASGQPKHPHFEAVKATMGAMMQAATMSGAELSMEDAYERAVWADPTLRAKLTQAQQAEAARAAEAQRKAAVEKAKVARTPVTASARTPAKDEDDGLTRRQLIEKEYHRVTAASGARI